MCWVGEDVLVESLLVLGELVVHEEARARVAHLVQRDELAEAKVARAQREEVVGVPNDALR